MSYSARCLSLCLLTLLACGREAPGAEVAAARPAPPLPRPNTPAPAPPLVHLPLADRLASEAGARPARAVRTRALVEALSSRGIKVAQARQVLAAPIGADYCESTVSESGLVLALCEFDSPARARAGQKRSRSLFDALVPHRILIENGNALLTLATNDSAEARREAELTREAFMELTPSPLGG